MNIAKAVKLELVKQNMTSLDLAKRSNLSRDGIYKATNNINRFNGLISVASSLGLSLSELIAKAEDQK